MNLAELQREAHAIAKSKSWWDEERTFGDLIALVHSELSEALEWYREWDSVRPMREESPQYGLDDPLHGKYKPVGVPSELADVVVRVADICEHYGARLSVPPSFPHLDTFGEWITHVHYCVALAGRKHWDDDYRWCEDLEDVVGLIQRMAAHYGIDLDAAIEAKMEYNRTRSYRHGGKAL